MATGSESENSFYVPRAFLYDDIREEGVGGARPKTRGGQRRGGFRPPGNRVNSPFENSTRSNFKIPRGTSNRGRGIFQNRSTGRGRPISASGYHGDRDRAFNQGAYGERTGPQTSRQRGGAQRGRGSVPSHIRPLRTEGWTSDDDKQRRDQKRRRESRDGTSSAPVSASVNTRNTRQRDNCRGNTCQASIKSPNQAQAKRQPTLPPIPKEELQSLLEENPSDILSTLVSRKEKYMALLNQDTFDDIAFMLTLRVLSRICDLDAVSAVRQDLNTVMSMVESSGFLSKHLSRYLVSLSTAQPHDQDGGSCDENIASDVNMMLKLLEVFLLNKPNDCGEVGVVLIILGKVVTKEALNNVEFDPQGGLMRQVQQLSDSFVSLEKDLQSKKQRSMAKQPPDNFRYIPIFPESSEIRKPTKPFLRKNIIKGRYENVEHYLDVQFRLLREDFVAPLREGVTEFLSDTKSHLQDIRIYKNVRILKKNMTRNGFVYKLQFDVSGLKRVHWEASKRLIYGSFVCLTKDKFQHILCAAIENRNIKDLENGIVDVRFLTDIGNADPKGIFIMAESAAYFEACRHVLQGLQQMSDATFPFKKFIVEVSSDIDPPLYIQHDDNITYDLTPLVDSHGRSIDDVLELRVSKMRRLRAAAVPILQSMRWPSAESLHLDESQKEALQAALTKEFVIIKGPPGTGKTYIGLKIIQILLRNKHWNNLTSPEPDSDCSSSDDEEVDQEDNARAPILVVCYTNHALDQFLEGIIAHGEKNVVRVGGRSSSEILESKNLSKIRRDRPRTPRQQNVNVRQLKERLRENEENVKNTLRKLDLAKTIILNANVLKDYMTKENRRDLFMPWIRSGEKPNPTTNLLWWLNVVDSTILTPGESYNKSQENHNTSNRIHVEDEGSRIQQERQMYDDSRRSRDHCRETEEDDVYNEIAAYDVNCTKRCGKNQVSTPKSELQNQDCMSDEEAAQVKSIWPLRIWDRWRLYRLWIERFIEAHEKMLNSHRQLYEILSKQMKDVNAEDDALILREASVVGMTTTGAARCRSVLQLLGPRIVVVEEAAEVLEAHIITTLTTKCQHLILIGDHQQLKPNPTVYRLAKVFNMDTSLFERMINNDVPYQSLTHQHRMRPEISKLMKKHFYKNLHDDESVMGFDDIKGVTLNMFFIDHDHFEDEGDDNKTKSNQYEAEFLVELCRYLLLQGYKPSQITILTTYLGQLFSFKKLMDKETFEGVRVSVVDNFQGEENDIILLSLVRSNEDGSIGFLKTSNRVCVALSRARMGFYCIGNASILKKAPIWQDIISTLKADNRIGSSLQLVCQNHPDKVSEVASADDFKEKVPDGGCVSSCEYKLPCGHICALYCHPNDHSKYKCLKPCMELCERQEHSRRIECYKRGGKCFKNVLKSIPKCGHEFQIECHKFELVRYCTVPCPNTLTCGHSCTETCGQECTNDCQVKVELILNKCGHKNIVECFKSRRDVSCTHKCEKMLACGHTCPNKCSKSCPDEKIEDLEEYLEIMVNDSSYELCAEKCKSVLPCGHPCPNKCGEPCPKTQVDSSKRKFIELGGNKLLLVCMEMVHKKLPDCNHTVPVECYKDVSSLPCFEICNEELSCGHRCTCKCGVPCVCRRSMQRKLPSCGHSVRLPCYKNVASHFCSKKCQTKLACGHQCPNNCGELCPGKERTITSEGDLVDPSRNNAPATACQRFVRKELPGCGHSVVVPCYQDVESVSCPEKCTKILPCKHRCPNRCCEPCPCRNSNIEDKHSDSSGNESSSGQDNGIGHNGHVFARKCQEIVTKELSVCGHSIQIPCHKNAKVLVCPKPCEKILSCGHGCSKECGQPCPRGGHIIEEAESISSEEKEVETLLFMGNRNELSEWKCRVPVEKMLPLCRHIVVLPCYKNATSAVCPKPCEKILPCGHQCPNKCDEMCLTSETCEAWVKKRLSFCSHVVKTHCHTEVSSLDCTEKCEKELQCGHRCPKRCGEPCQEESVAGGVPCTKPCLYVLPCEHICPGVCGECDRDDEHERCDSTCGKILLCGHICPGVCVDCVRDDEHELCNGTCGKILLCGHICENKCIHKVCSPNCRKCRMGTTEKTRGPKHKRFQCNHKTKGSDLFTDVCTLPCSKKLRCNHFCIGVCSEPCPPFCFMCDKKKVADNLHQKAVRPGETFIYLKDCKHLCETKFLDKKMAAFRNIYNTSCVHLRYPLCPKCNQEIRNCTRYEEFLQTITKSINKAIKRVCAEPEVSRDTAYPIQSARVSAVRSGATTTMSFAFERWRRCPNGHVIYQDSEQQRENVWCPDCTQYFEVHP